MNHLMLLSKKGLREHIEMILLVNYTGLNYYLEVCKPVRNL